MANRMSLFYAQATPMLRVLSDTTSKFVSEVSNKAKKILRVNIQNHLTKS